MITAVGALIGVFAGVAAAIKESDEQLAEWQQAMADTIDYIKNNPDANTGDVLKYAHQFVEFVYEDE